MLEGDGSYDPMNDEFVRVVDGRFIVYRKAPAPAPPKLTIKFFPNRFDLGLDEQSAYFAA